MNQSFRVCKLFPIYIAIIMSIIWKRGHKVDSQSDNALTSDFVVVGGAGLMVRGISKLSTHGYQVTSCLFTWHYNTTGDYCNILGCEMLRTEDSQSSDLLHM